MTKTEQTRLLTWRWKVLLQVAAGWPAGDGGAREIYRVVMT